MSVTVEEPRSITSELDDFANIALADILAVNESALSAVIGRAIPESSVPPVPVASFGSAI
jgi:FXSXX-COOH protein